MSCGDNIQNLLKHNKAIVLDGALATELEARGCDLDDPIWSSKALLDKPEIVQQVHEDYFRAGADVAITASYQLTLQGLTKKDRGQDFDALVKLSVEVAQQARAKVLEVQPRRIMLVAGSVGPYGAYLGQGNEYTGDYSVPHYPMQDFHRPRIQALVDAGVDLLACETMPSFKEIRALADLLSSEFPTFQAWFSFTLRDVLHIADGTPISEVLALFNDLPNIVAVGVNCVPRERVLPALKHMGSLTSKPLLAYPSSGEQWDAGAKEWYGDRAGVDDLAHLIGEWRGAGARFIGGCCRTGLEDIQVIRNSLAT